MTLLSDARSLLLQAANGSSLSEAQRSRMREVAWELSPCTCGRGPKGRGHNMECLSGVFTPPYEVGPRLRGTRAADAAEGPARIGGDHE